MIIRADARQIPLANGCVQCVVTSPPYWGLRDYGVTGQIGLESSIAEYVETMAGVFREVWRVLRDDGTVWLNLGDSYARNGGEAGGENRQLLHMEGKQRRMTKIPDGDDLKPKNLCGVPWRVAFALQADGWWLRSDIIWAKPNPMPESVTDRPTRSHEYLFLLSKGERYYYDANAIREPGAESTFRRWGANPSRTNQVASGHHVNGEATCGINPAGRNRRSVWTINSEPYPESHFATFPKKLIEPCILAGSKQGDLCFDPFGGSGTVGEVCEALGRRWVMTELSADYCGLASKRTSQIGLFAGVGR
ncbi:MAG: DNA-methyltransferase [Candidatus Binataceae bacterium]